MPRPAEEAAAVDEARAAAKVEPDGSGIEMPSRYVGETLDLFFVSFYLVTTTPQGWWG